MVPEEPLTERADLAGLEPTRNTVEMECVIALPPEFSSKKILFG
jgi:hypothetical protein